MASRRMKDGREIVEMIGPCGRKCVTEDEVKFYEEKGYREADSRTVAQAGKASPDKALKFPGVSPADATKNAAK